MSSGEEDATNRHYEYNWIDGAEKLEKYRPGGYHPIMIGDVLHGRYRIVDKLGFGGYSTVWLAQDTSLKRYVAVKIGIANSIPRETNTLRALSAPLPPSSLRHPGCDSMPLPLDEFELKGPNGTHVCYITAPARCNLREVSYSRLFPLDVTRALSAGLTLAVAYMHSRGYVHGDIHLRNVLVKLPSGFDHLSIEQLYKEYGEPETVPITRCDGEPLPPNVPAKAVIPLYLGKDAKEFLLSDAKLLLSDFGEAFAPDSEFRPGKDCHTPLPVRPPEARFEPDTPLSYSADIWSLATAIWEILGMKAIFFSEFVTPDELVADHNDLLGSMPHRWWERWEEKSQFFDDNRRPREGREVSPPIDKAFEEKVQKWRRKTGMGEYEKEETAAILDLMRRMLAFEPDERLTAEEVLQSEWMTKWALPDLERSLQME
ncbi:kinase domain protein [Xylona heveae TC161]|uniref:non-specific serine/threonine protein kinase n=1 Tax=Xylona heveae (strain CBS 132557 / TC161) TaxID=1328760 RepID=A0A165H0B3_XYLHT|nr:kinase domain protein [Xylona heveae TC161]KZF22827.1 kinase domain protein [Xylona heveae TC161]